MPCRSPGRGVGAASIGIMSTGIMARMLRQDAPRPPRVAGRFPHASARRGARARTGLCWRRTRPGAGAMGIDAEITGLLNAARSGDAAAQDAAYALVYDEL